jgi:hypothetical protein
MVRCTHFNPRIIKKIILGQEMCHYNICYLKKWIDVLFAGVEKKGVVRYQADSSGSPN